MIKSVAIQHLITDIRYGFTGSATWNTNGVGFIRITDIDDNGNVDYARLPSVKISPDEAERYYLDPGDCLFARSGSVGKVHIYNGPTRKAVFASYLIRAKFDQSKVDPAYFGVFSRSEFYWKQIDNLQRGGVQQNLNTDAIGRITIPLPPVSMQKQIAAILEKADAAREKRRQANQLTEQFLQSAFLEMFGDPVTNPRAWEIKTVEEVTTSHDSRRVPIESSIREGRHGVYPYYGASGVIDYVNDFIFDIETVLIGEDGANLLARSTPIAFIAKGKYWVNNHAHVLTPKDSMTHKYLVFFFNQTDLKPYVSGSAQPKLTAANLSRIPIPVPPLPEQQKFAALVEEVEGLRGKQRESERELENLFQSLMQKAFRGELVT